MQEPLPPDQVAHRTMRRLMQRALTENGNAISGTLSGEFGGIGKFPVAGARAFPGRAELPPQHTMPIAAPGAEDGGSFERIPRMFGQFS